MDTNQTIPTLSPRGKLTHFNRKKILQQRRQSIKKLNDQLSSRCITSYFKPLKEIETQPEEEIIITVDSLESPKKRRLCISQTEERLESPLKKRYRKITKEDKLKIILDVLSDANVIQVCDTYKNQGKDLSRTTIYYWLGQFMSIKEELEKDLQPDEAFIKAQQVYLNQKTIRGRHTLLPKHVVSYNCIICC